MKKLFAVFIFTFFILPDHNAFSQGFHTNSNRALKSYNDGVSAFDFLDFSRAEKQFKAALLIDNNFYEAYMMLGDLYTKQNRYIEASANYRSAVRLDSLFYKPVFFSLANAEMMSGDYSDALIHYNVYLEQKGISENNRKSSIKNLKNCEFAQEAIKNPVPFSPVSIGSAINTTDDEYWPSITADGQMLMFTRQPVINGNRVSGMQSQEDFYISIFSDNIWQKAFNAGPPLNTPNNEGAQTLSSNGNYMFFTACDRQGGYGSCDIYFSALADGRWTEPYNLGPPVNTSSWESQPSVSSDGKMLYWSSSRPGGSGGKDIWYSVMNEKGRWTTPVNMGPNINTEGDEMSPFIHFDNRTLYFSSDGRVGMGGFDIYVTRMNDDSTWTKPKNLGYPINTYNDEMGLIIESGGQKAYFSSVREIKNGKDIFVFDLYEKVRPTPVSYLKGRVIDSETGALLKADYELTNLSTGKKAIENMTDNKGNFLVCLPSGFNYGINVSKTGYLFYSENFMFEGQYTVAEPFIKMIKLSPIKVGGRIQLSNVFFETDSWQLKKESILELDNLFKLLSANKDLVVEIDGFTDSTGTDEHNMVLSEKRALSVVNYLKSRGIDPDRLRYRGYGRSSPIGDNITTEGRKLNRRTEVRIIDRKK
jgi:flagellar motor protein MotB